MTSIKMTSSTPKFGDLRAVYANTAAPGMSFPRDLDGDSAKVFEKILNSRDKYVNARGSIFESSYGTNYIIVADLKQDYHNIRNSDPNNSATLTKDELLEIQSKEVNSSTFIVKTCHEKGARLLHAFNSKPDQHFMSKDAFRDERTKRIEINGMTLEWNDFRNIVISEGCEGLRFFAFRDTGKTYLVHERVIAEFEAGSVSDLVWMTNIGTSKITNIVYDVINQCISKDGHYAYFVVTTPETTSFTDSTSSDWKLLATNIPKETIKEVNRLTKVFTSNAEIHEYFSKDWRNFLHVRYLNGNYQFVIYHKKLQNILPVCFVPFLDTRESIFNNSPGTFTSEIKRTIYNRTISVFNRCLFDTVRPREFTTAITRKNGDVLTFNSKHTSNRYVLFNSDESASFDSLYEHFATKYMQVADVNGDIRFATDSRFSTILDNFAPVPVKPDSMPISEVASTMTSKEVYDAIMSRFLTSMMSLIHFMYSPIGIKRTEEGLINSTDTHIAHYLYLYTKEIISKRASVYNILDEKYDLILARYKAKNLQPTIGKAFGASMKIKGKHKDAFISYVMNMGDRAFGGLERDLNELKTQERPPEYHDHMATNAH
jgi:hypothetical protein